MGKDRTHVMRRSYSQFEYTCASSTGGPGLNLGEQSAGRSMLGTKSGQRDRPDHGLHPISLMMPSVGLAESGSAISALIPQTIVVSPILTSADPSAVDIEPKSDQTGLEERTA